MKIAAIAKVIKDRGSCRLYRVHGSDDLETKFYIGTNSEIYSLEGFPKPWSERFPVLCYPGRNDRAGGTSSHQSVRQFAGNAAEDGEHGSGNGTAVQDGGQRDGMILEKEAIEKAVNWWAEKILEDRPHSNGDDNFTSITACLLADMGRQNITSDQADTFKKALAKRMTEYAESGRFNHFSIMSDYGPCGMLIDAANEAGISAANFPFKTTMFVTEKDGIIVRDGYGAPAVKLWG